MAYIMTLKSGAIWQLGDDGRVLHDGDRNMGPFSEQWRVIGFSTRFNAHRVISLQEAADGEPIGQGWVHDLDHGFHRVWGHPSNRRAVSITNES